MKSQTDMEDTLDKGKVPTSQYFAGAVSLGVSVFAKCQFKTPQIFSGSHSSRLVLINVESTCDSCSVSTICVWMVYVSHREVDICWFHHFLIPLGGSRICLGGRETLQLRERGGEIKSLTDIIFRIFTNLPEGCCTQYSFHSLLNIPLTQGDMGGRCLEISCW